MAAHFVRYNQPDGFDALREETREFTEVRFATATPSIEPGDHLVLFNTPEKHLFAIVTVTAPGYRRDDDDSHHPFAVPVQPEHGQRRPRLQAARTADRWTERSRQRRGLAKAVRIYLEDDHSSASARTTISKGNPSLFA